MKIKITALTALLFCLSISCNKDSKLQEKKVTPTSLTLTDLEEEGGQGVYHTDTAKTPSPPPGNEKKKQPVQEVPAPKLDWDKKIIKTAFLNFEVKDYKTFYPAFREKVRNLGGYVAQEEQSQSDYKIENTLVIKVPVDQFDNALSQLTTGSEKINERKITSQDVTSEYVDTRSRIEAKKQVRQRYIDLLSQAKNMEEILNVQSEINGIQEEIESATGRVEYLGHSSAYSTINLTYFQVINPSALNNKDKTPIFGTRLATAFKTGWAWIVDLLVGLVSIWPIILLSFGIVALVKRSKYLKPKQA